MERPRGLSKHINSGAAKAILTAPGKGDIKNIVYASSSSVYSGLPNDISIFKEDLRLETPNSMYAITKLTNEMQANLYSKRFFYMV